MEVCVVEELRAGMSPGQFLRAVTQALLLPAHRGTAGPGAVFPFLTNLGLSSDSHSFH